ncbi:MAG: hypothetical protein HYR60_31365 [Acidobacteria bacterium]|nr:hypothetical protein [Acidobacteriota bacterium]
MGGTTSKEHRGRGQTRILTMHQPELRKRFARENRVTPAMKLFRDIRGISSKVPKNAWRSVPADGSHNLDHYLYGSPSE